MMSHMENAMGYQVKFQGSLVFSVKLYSVNFKPDYPMMVVKTLGLRKSAQGDTVGQRRN